MKFPLGDNDSGVWCERSGNPPRKEILYKAVKDISERRSDAPGCHKSLQGDIREIKAVEFVDQNPIGTSSRSNPATYLKAFDEIRKLFSEQQLAKQMDSHPPSFLSIQRAGDARNAKEGTITIPMQFMAGHTD